MSKKVFMTLTLLLFAIGAVFSARKKEVQHPENMNSWQKEFDINKKSGKYNILVEAEDQAGNIETAGPYNIFIDEESDLPVTGITNPTEQMRVLGNLNIVGTCTDDDKVAEVWLILDGDKENPVRAQGTDFWSYYLDTTNLLEGPHTIEVYGIDDGNPEAYRNSETGEIDEAKVIPKTGRSAKVTWQLDRRAPVIEINADNHYMGELVRGKINLIGKVRDGNGIKGLEFSTDGGRIYTEAKIKEVKLKTPDEDGISSYWTFNIPLDTKKLYSDGAATCWFKAVDNAGSVGKYAFLFFVDNTNPEIVIVSPQPNEVQNGIFTVAGYAYDANHISELTYEFGSEKGSFTLTPGNPYFIKDFDSRGKSGNSVLTITATDTMGNVAVKKQNILLNQEEDKPCVTIAYPAHGLKVSAEDGSFYVRGIASDDDGVVKVVYSLDGKNETAIDSNGVFYAQIPGELSDGTHEISVYAIDKYGVKGNAVKNTFVAIGAAPKFENPKYSVGKNSVDYVPGMKINPEENGSLEISVNSSVGVTDADYQFFWGNGESSEKVDVTFNDALKSAKIKIPLGDENLAWGISKLLVRALDVRGHISEYRTILNISDLTKPHLENPGIYFTDSTVDETGGFLTDGKNTLQGYFVGGEIASVTIIPSIRGISVKNQGNLVSVESSDSSEEFIVRVTTSFGATYDSRKLHFMKKGKLPSLEVAQAADSEKGIPLEFETARDRKTISGSVDDSSTRVSYRIFGVKVNYDENGFVSSSEVIEPGEFIPLSLDRRQRFSIENLKSDDFVDGISVVEIMATNDSGSTTKSVFVKKINPVPKVNPDDENASAKKPAEPALYWLKGNDYYGIAVYQGSLGGKEHDEDDEASDRSEFVLIKYDDILASQQKLVLRRIASDVDAVLDPKAKKGTLPSRKVYSVELTPPPVQSSVEAYFTKIDEEDYKSGMNILLPRGTSKEAGHSIFMKAKSANKITSVEYKISGENFAGGDASQSGNFVPAPVSEGSDEYEFSIPLFNLPARMTNLEVTIKDIFGQKTFKASFMVLREHKNIDNEAKVYWAELGSVKFNQDSKSYVLNSDESLYGFINAQGTFTSSLRGASGALSVETEGNLVKISSASDGSFKDISVRIAGSDGASYTSSPVSIVVDTANPEISLSSLTNMSYVGNKLLIAGRVTDGNGISKAEYSLEDKKTDENVEQNWTKLNLDRNGNFSVSADISEYNDGYIPLSIRAYDTTGKESVLNYVFFKDVTPPEVEVIIPVAEMKVSDKKGIVNEINGETDIVFKVKDNGCVNSIRYTSADSKITDNFEIYKNAENIPVKTETVESQVPGAEGEETQTVTNEVPVALSKDPLRTMNSPLPNMRIGTSSHPHDNKMNFTFTDGAGNSTVVNKWEFIVNEESDKPKVEIHLPVNNQVITTDFTISGLIYDDDGLSQFFYKIDNEEWQSYDNGLATSNFKIDKKLESLTDNEHTISAYAIDQNGVKGKEVRSTFRVSLEEPKGTVIEPDISKTVTGLVTLKGTASDKNGINKVQISVDNGATYNDAVGGEEWSYTFDTRAIQDGTHVVFIKIWDGYDIVGLYTSLINIDNTAPELRLELPLDDSKTSKDLFFSGQTTDNVKLTELYLKIRSLENKSVPKEFEHKNLVPSEIISERVDLSSFANGFYNVELTGTDAAGNITRISRNIELNKEKPLVKVDLLYPLNGSHIQGEFNIYGMISAEKTDPVETIEFYLDGDKVEPASEPISQTANGYYKIHLDGKVKFGGRKVDIAEGLHKYQIVVVTASGKTVSSAEQTFVYSAKGPWVTLENFTYGDFAVNRPLLKGKAGYVLSEGEKEILKIKDAPSELKRSVEQKKVKMIYISFDNGKTYTPVAKEGKTNWSYRVENLDIPAGYHFMLIKAEMYNGENAITRTIVQVDRTNPSIRLISPGEGGHYNQMLDFQGLSSDDIELKDVRLILRKGDKSSYEVPEFIRGLYLDANIWGSTLYSVGIGLTAFDNAVKIQGQFGRFTQEQRYFICDTFGLPRSDYRFGGNVIGGKIIAQIVYIPFRYFFGRDWDWLSATISVGANFSYFSDSGASIVTGERVPQVLSAALAQVEFPRVSFSNLKAFKNWSLYIEPQVWFIPSDVASASDDAKKYVFTASAGLRTTVF